MGRHPCFLPWESALRLLSNSFQWKIKERWGEKEGEQEERGQTDHQHEEEEKKEEEEALEDLGLSQKHEPSLWHN